MKARGGFTLIEVLLAAIILGLGLTGILVSMSQAQRFMQTMPDLLTAQEVIDVPERDVDEIWRDISGANGPQMTREQSEKYHGYTWKREDLDATTSDEDLKRVGYIHRVRITVIWGDRFRGDKNMESYVSLWRDPQNTK